MWFIALIAFLWILVSFRSLRDRITTLEEQVARLREPAGHEEPAPVESAPVRHDIAMRPLPIPPAPSEPSSPVPPAPMPTPQTELFLVRWFKEQTLIKIGSIIFFLGAVWFVSYAIENDWISPLMRIVLGVALGGVVYALGLWRHEEEPKQHQVLTALGTAIILGTVTASQFAFLAPVVPAAVALTLMVASIAYTLAVAVRTNGEWLGIAASIAGFVVPFLVSTIGLSGFGLLLYTTALSSAFLLVVFFTRWRAITLTAVLGAALHLSIVAQADLLSDLALWLFAIVFSGLFLASTTVSVLRTNTPTTHDVVTVAIVGLQYVVYALLYTTYPEIAFFTAAMVTAAIGYTLRLRGADADAVSLYAAMSLVGILGGTALLFDGFILTIVYALETLAIYLFTLKIATVKRSVFVAALLFIIPALSGLNDLYFVEPASGLLQAEFLGALFVLLALGGAAGWTMRAPNLQAVNWLRRTAAVLWLGWYWFAVTASFTAADALISTFSYEFTTTVFLTLIATVAIWYVARFVPRTNWRVSVVFTLILPTITAAGLLSNWHWHSGFPAETFWGAAFFTGCLLLTTATYWRFALKHTAETGLATTAYGLTWLAFAFTFRFLHTIWESILVGDMYRVVTALSLVLLVYLTVNLLLHLRVSTGKLLAFLLVLIAPALMLLPSFDGEAWVLGVVDINALGLYVTITVLVLLGITFRQHQSLPQHREISGALFTTAGLAAFGLVWAISQNIFASEALAVTVALFIYTVCGLVAYSYGRASGNTGWHRAGVLLLAAVVVRLALVDFWVMERIWQVVTFLGIGALFIGAALVERRKPERTERVEPDVE